MALADAAFQTTESETAPAFSPAAYVQMHATHGFGCPCGGCGMIRAGALGGTGTATPLALGESCTGNTQNSPEPQRLRADHIGLSAATRCALLDGNIAKYGPRDGPVVYAADLYRLAQSPDCGAIVAYLNTCTTSQIAQRTV